MKRVVNFRLDDGELTKWRAAAEAEGRTVSNWIVMKCREAIAEPPKISDGGVELDKPILPRARSAKRNHVNVPPEGLKKGRCTYLAIAGTKCPRCKEVHPL